MIVVKRDGREVEFDKTKIQNAVKKAFCEVDSIVSEYACDIADRIADFVYSRGVKLTVEEIQDIVEDKLMECDRKDVAKAYIKYRHNRHLVRQSNTTDKTIIEVINNTNEYWKFENSNKNPQRVTTQRDYIAGVTSTDITKRLLLPLDVVKAHDEGIIHFHDADYFAQKALHNCDLVNLEDMLQNNTVVSDTLVEKPHSFSTACTITTQIIAQVASSQYGGQSISLAALAPFVDISRQTITKSVLEEYEMLLGEGFDKDKYASEIHAAVKNRLQAEITKGIQTIQYQVVTLMTTNGQAPFITVLLYVDEAKNEQEKEDLAWIIEETLKQRIQGVKNRQGVWITPAFPKLIYVLDEDNITEDSPYWYLTKLAAECTAKRMVPDYISAKMMRKLKGDVYTCMGCRSFLTPDRFTDAGIGNIAKAKNYVEGEHKYYGRFNQGVVTINLPYLALLSGGDFEKFWEIFNEKMELCHKALRCRHERLLGTVSDVAPILWQDGALARLESGETIDKLLYNGYSTISLGFAGLYECVKYMTGVSHSTPEGHDFGIKVMQALNDACKKWKAEENIDYSVYGTPIESVTYKFAKSLQDKFGIIEGVTDRDYVTNSYHIPVFEEIDPFDKLSIEAEFQALAPGGAISYIETSDLSKNVDIIIDVMRFIYDNIMYAELNTKLDYCQKCGYDGEIEIIDEGGKLIWKCPNCENTDTSTMNVARRTCGYIGTNFWNAGRTQEIKERYVHIDDHEEV